MEDWKKVVKSVAPTIGLALGGPFAGAATAYLSEKLFGDENVPEKNIEDFVLSASPDKLVKIRQIDADFKVKMEELKVKRADLESKDRQSARKLAETTSIAPQIALSVLFIGGYFFIIYALFAGQIQFQQGERDLANILLGVLTAGIPMILRFWFGGSLNDDKQLDKIYHSIPKDRL